MFILTKFFPPSRQLPRLVTASKSTYQLSFSLKQPICSHHPATLLRPLQPLHTVGGDPQFEAPDPVTGARDQLPHASAYRRTGEAKLSERGTRPAGPCSCDRLP